MKLKNIYIGYTVILAVLLTTSCKKLVDIDEPIDTITNSKIFNSDEQANQALSGMYSQMLGVRTMQLTYGGASIYGGLAADELIPDNAVSSPEDNAFFKNALLPDNVMSEFTLWTSAYKVIYTANSILDGEKASISEKLTASKRNELKGAAKFMRAFCLFYLTNFYGEVPVPLSSNYNETIQLLKSPQSQLYKQLIADLNEAVEHFKNIMPTPTAKSRINQYSAEALLARIYLYQKNWELANIHASNVINSGKYILGSIERTFEANSQEAIFQMTVNEEASLGANESFYLAPLISLYLIPKSEQDLYTSDKTIYESILPYLVPKYYLHDNLLNAFEPNDRRKTIWANFNGSPNVAPYNGKKTYFSNKYPADGVKRRVYMLIRLAEMHLIRAEALTMQNKPDLAREDINKIRNRAGLGSSSATDQQELMDAIIKERQTELFTEWSHRFFDLKRTGNALSILGSLPEKSGLNANKLVFPIPLSEISRNPKLTQNTGY